MADVLGHGPDEPSRRPRWLLPAAVVLALSAGALTVDVSWPLHRPATEDRPEPSRRQSPEPPDARSPTTPWPDARGACGSVAALPRATTAPLQQRTGLRILVGGAGLREVDIDRRTARLIPVRGMGRGGQVTQLAATRTSVHALQLRCSDLTAPAGTALTLDRRDLAVAQPAVTGADVLLAASDRAWSFAHPRRPLHRRVALHPLDGGPVRHMPVTFVPAAATRRLILGQTTGAPGTVQAIPRNGKGRPRVVASGSLLAATERLLLTSNGCPFGSRCVLRVDSDDGTRRTIALPPGRAVASDVTLSRDGRRAVFQLSRPHADRRWTTGHPMPPSDVAVLNLGTGGLDLVPGLRLAPKSLAGMTFSRDGRWLVLALNEGGRTRLLLWRSQMDRVADVPVALPGRVLYVVPVLDVS